MAQPIPDPVPDETAATAEIHRLGPREAYRTLLARNDALIRSADLDNGRAIVTARSAIHTALVRHWAEEQHRAAAYEKPFAVVALGGTGRAEMVPYSDTDFALLFDDALEGNAFLLEMQRQLLHSNEFAERCGFTCAALPFSLDAVPELVDKQLNSFLDMRPVYDPHHLADRFRTRIRATCDSFSHFLHVRGFWKEQWERAAGESERLDQFDIKNAGLRLFLAGIWTMAGEGFRHSHEVYATLEDRRDLEAYDFLLRIRAFVHSRRPQRSRPGLDGSHPEDVLHFEDFTSFGELLGSGADERACFDFCGMVRARLLSARRRVAQFAKAAIESELRGGRPIAPGSAIVFTVAGLGRRDATENATATDRSRAALALLLAAQHYEVPLDPAELETTFRNAGDWLVRVPELSGLFYEQRGSLADSLAFLGQIDGAAERLFPGYARFESSLDRRVFTERTWLRGALTHQKLCALERLVREGRSALAAAVAPERLTDLSQGVNPAIEAALLDADHLAAVKLALKTKRLPVTPADETLHLSGQGPLIDRFASGLSGIPLREYFERFRESGGFAPETLALTEFLISQRRAFKEYSEAGMNDDQRVREFAGLFSTADRLRALFVFTCADRTEWESARSDPTRWFTIRELYVKAMALYHPGVDPAHALVAAGYAPEQLAILHDFGRDFFGGVYRQYANRFGAHLVRLVEQPENSGPKVALLRDGTLSILGVAARDMPGLAAVITGACWRQNLALRQAHLFSAANYGLALDFFHIVGGEKPPGPEIAKTIEEAIQQRRFIAESDEALVPPVTGVAVLNDWIPGKYCLRFETAQDSAGLIYALTYRVYRRLRGDIFGLAAHTGRGPAFVSIYLALPPDLTLADARTIVARDF